MKCDKIKDLLKTDYLDSRAAAEEISQIKAHLAVCPDCRRLEQELSDQRALFRQSPRIGPPERVWRRIREAIVSERLERENRAQNWGLERLKRLFWQPKPVFALTGVIGILIFAAVFSALIIQNRLSVSQDTNAQIFAEYSLNSDSDSQTYDLGSSVEKYFL